MNTYSILTGPVLLAALTLTADMDRELFLVMTYVVVIFSILVQGLTIERLVRRLFPTKEGGGGAQVQ
jgi:CPA1 family monovalent cation:H+ antiporter